MSSSISRTQVQLTHCAVIGTDEPLSAQELARLCAAPLEWVAELVDAGIVASATHTSGRFDSADLAQALAARRLQRDFDMPLDAAGLVLDLQQEVRRLRALMLAHGWHG